MNLKTFFSTLALSTAMLTLSNNTPVFAGEQSAALTVTGTPTINLELKDTSRPFVQLVSDVVYAQVPDRGYTNKAMTMHLVIPQDKKPHPVILYINGGGFINANKDGYMQQWLDLAEHGYVVASMTYRVSPTSTFPAPLEDVKSAVRFLRANAEKFSIDAKHIGVFGGSAGGYLAAMAGTTNGVKGFDKGENLNYSSDVQAVVDVYGVSDVTKIGADYNKDVQKAHESAAATEALWVNGSPVFGGKDGGIMANPEGAKAANPLTYISQKTAPFLLMHGDADFVVSPSQTELLREELAKHNIEATRYLVKGAAHGGPYWVQPEVMDIVIAFYDKHLKNE